MQAKNLYGLLLLLGLLWSLPALAADSAKGLVKDFKKAIAKEEEDNALSLIDQIVALPAEDAFDALFEIGFGEAAGSEKVFEKILAGFSRVEGSAAKASERYDKVSGKGDFRERVFIMDILVKSLDSQGEAARAGLIAAIEDKSDHVQSAAVKGLEASMHREAISPLIKLLDDLSQQRRRDAVYFDVRDALLTLTGQEFEIIEDWYKWWEPNADTFDPKSTDSGGKTGVVRRKKKGDADFLGVPIFSKNVVFVLDKSASMYYVMRDDIKGLASGDGSDKGQREGPKDKPTPETKRMAEFWSRWGTAQRNLKRVIQKLQPGTMYNIVSFSSDTQVFKKKAVPANGGNNKKASQWVDSQKPDGETYTLEALEKAFNADARTTHIYFLSDGIPSKDGLSADPTGPILDKVREWNRYRKIKIYTFGYDSMTFPARHPIPSLDVANKFLQELAESTGGKFTLIKASDKIGPDNPYPPDEGDE